MTQQIQNLTVMDVAAICGVARSTVSYWISKKDLKAQRFGNKYMVSIDDLVIFLRSEGRPIHHDLLQRMGDTHAQTFPSFLRCWEYWKDDSRSRRCQECNVFRRQISECFTAAGSRNMNGPSDCHKCRYFVEFYEPEMAFIHQIDKPASISKGLYLWSGNKQWAELCGVDTARLVGMGVEEFIHPDSLKICISYNKRRSQGDETVPDRFLVGLSQRNRDRRQAYLAISPLKRPANTWLAVAEPVE